MYVILFCSDLSLSLVYFFFFFKQKTAYEMRISDWSSDVCSSDLNAKCRQRYRGFESLTLLHFSLISTQANSRPGLTPGRLECLAPDAEQRRRRQRGDNRADDQEQHDRDDDHDGGVAERLVFGGLHQYRQPQIEKIEPIEAEQRARTEEHT